MFKLVVLLACVVAVTVAEPGIGAYGLGHGYGYAHGYGAYAAIPTAVSHQSSINIHSKPIIKTVVAAAPVIAKPYYSGYISKPILSYAAPQLSYGSNYLSSAPLVGGLYGSGLGYQGLGGHGWGYGHGLGYGLGYRNNYYGSYY